MGKILNIEQLIVEDFQKRQLELAELHQKIGIKLDSQQMEDELKEFRLEIEVPEFRQLIAALSKLVHAAKNKSAYLEEHSEELNQIEINNVEQCDCLGNSRLLLAIERGDIDKALLFIHRNMFINQANQAGITPLMCAATKGLNSVAEALLQQDVNLDAGVSVRTPYKTALYSAILARKQTVVTRLAAAGAKVNFEFKGKVEDKIEKFSLIDLARDCGIKLTLSSSLPLEPQDLMALFQYVADSVLKKNPECSSVMRWLRDHHYKVDDFFLAYTLMQYGDLNKNLYLKVANAFKEKYRIELEESYGRRFMPYLGGGQTSALYIEAKKSLGSMRDTVLDADAIKIVENSLRK